MTEREHRILFHYTCAHAANKIGRRGLLFPYPQPFAPEIGPVVWLSDLAVPDRWALGLTSRYLSCDRTEYRYRVATKLAVPYSAMRGLIRPDVRADLEAFGQADRWWVSRHAVEAVRA